ncbi:sensor histidine kinase [Sphingorhabdus lutea]|uniref:sensor histidine kinase n=1 Tax=Sphingorhabdus lutea TaxID=1913578 RepID=UPI0018DDAFD2|nr:ATP-binding protein [Sphingorhabdus lutea]
MNWRTFAALLICIAGAVSASVLNTHIERIIIMLVCALISTFIFTYEEGNVARRKSSMLHNENDRYITNHPDFELFIQNSVDPLLIVNGNRVSHANKSALLLLGGQLVGMNIRGALRHAGAIEAITDPQKREAASPLILTGIGRPHQIWELRIGQLYENQLIIRLSDQTSRHAAEKMRVDFVANASHELLTPLASVKGFIETLQEGVPAKEQQTKFLNIMSSETMRMEALIRDLMSLSRIEAEKHDLATQEVNLEILCQEVCDILKNGSNPRGNDIIFVPEITNPIIRGDAFQLRQVVNNLLSNSMKYGKSGTLVELKLQSSRSDSMIILSVSDKGDGIPPEHIPRLTERFYRVDAGRSKALGGTGLGLSLVKHIVDRHRGYLDIKSELGVGTTISVSFPRQYPN